MKNLIKNGFTNESYMEDNQFVQYKKHNGLNHKTNYENLKTLSFVPKLISNNESVSKWEWIDGKEMSVVSQEDLQIIAKQMLELHNSKIQLGEFLLKKRVVEYRNILRDKNIKIPIVEQAFKKMNLMLKNMYKTTPVHGDLWQMNIIKTKENKIYFVDWEYSHMGDHHFDVAYFIESYNLTPEQEEVFLTEYDDYSPEILKKHKAFVHYLHILWLNAQEVKPYSDEDSIKKLENMFKEGF